MKKWRILILVGIGLIFLLSFSFYTLRFLIRSRAATKSVRIYIYPTKANLKKGEVRRFNVYIVPNGASDKGIRLGYIKFKVKFNTSLLNLEGYVQTPDNLNQINVYGPTAANKTGEIVVELGALNANTAPSLNGALRIASFGLRALDNASSKTQINIEKSSIQVVDLNEEKVNIANVSGSEVTIGAGKERGGRPTVITPSPTAKKRRVSPTVAAPSPTKVKDKSKKKKKTTPTSTPEVSKKEKDGSKGKEATFEIKLRLQGISGFPKSGVKNIMVKVSLQRVGTGQVKEREVEFTVDEKGIWHGTAKFSVGRGGYYLYVKGPKHIQKKICSLSPSEGFPGAYKCGLGETLQLEPGKKYTVDLSKIVLLVGDLPEQDGVVNSYDIALVRNLLGKTDADSLAKADVNLDGVVDTQDFALIQAALSVRYDDY